MSSWKPVVILCDEPGCRTQWVIADGFNIPEGRSHCAAKGWTTAGHKDYCPDHKPPPKRRRSIWYHGAHAAVQEALKFGVLVRMASCESCDAASSGTSILAHHDDYARPLDVRWLCEACHQAWHRANGPGANSFAEELEHA